MLQTNLFELLEARCETPETPSGSFRVTSVLAVCNRCRKRISVFTGQGLETIPGGCVITCPWCPSRLAVSNARFHHFFQTSEVEEKGCGDKRVSLEGDPP